MHDQTSFCQFDGSKQGDACGICGYELARDFDRPPARQCSGPGCQFLGEAEGTVKVQCVTCPGHYQQPAHRCQIHTRCLPHYAPTGAALTAWRERKPESDLYHLCAGCGEFEPA